MSDKVLVIDLDYSVCEVHGHTKHCAAYGSAKQLGYNPLPATRAGNGEILFSRMRTRSAESSRGVVRFVDELAGVRYAQRGPGDWSTYGWMGGGSRTFVSRGRRFSQGADFVPVEAGVHQDQHGVLAEFGAAPCGATSRMRTPSSGFDTLGSPRSSNV